MPGKSYSTYSLIKYDDDEHAPRTNYLQVAAWDYSNGVYQRIDTDLTDGYELTNVLEMTSAKIRLTFRLVNRFGEYETIILEYRGESVGDYTLMENGEAVQSGDLTYTGDERDPIEYEAVMSYIVENESDIDDIPQVFEMRITDSDVTSYIDIGFSYATIYLQDRSEEGLWGRSLRLLYLGFLTATPVCPLPSAGKRQQKSKAGKEKTCKKHMFSIE